MNQEQKAKAEQQRGVMAKQVLDNPVYQEAILKVKGKLMAQFENTSFLQKRKREDIWRSFKNLQRLEAEIIKVMQSGEMGKRTLSIIKRNKAVNEG